MQIEGDLVCSPLVSSLLGRQNRSEDNIKMDCSETFCLGCDLDECGSELCLVLAFGIKGFDLLDSSNGELISFIAYLPYNIRDGPDQIHKLYFG